VALSEIGKRLWNAIEDFGGVRSRIDDAGVNLRHGLRASQVLREFQVGPERAAKLRTP